MLRPMEDDEAEAYMDSLEAEHAFLVDQFNKPKPGEKWAPADFVYEGGPRGTSHDSGR